MLLLEPPEEVLLHIVVNVLRWHALHITKGQLLLGIAVNVLGWHRLWQHISERELLLELTLEEVLWCMRRPWQRRHVLLLLHMSRPWQRWHVLLLHMSRPQRRRHVLLLHTRRPRQRQHVLLLLL